MNDGPGSSRAESNPPGADGVEVRPLATSADFRAALELQRATWGDSFSDLVPAHVMKVAQRVGGVAAGAFRPDGTMLGFVFGLTGLQDGEAVHWSDMLAVREDSRGGGVGRMLKEHQRQMLVALGVATIQWSYDPLVARNAHLNLARLGARVREYVLDMYDDSDSPLHRGFGTDRLIVSWAIGVAARGAGEPIPQHGNAVAINVDEAGRPLPQPTLPPGDHPTAAIVVPPDIHDVLRTDAAAAQAWRDSTRAAFLAAVGSGFRVSTFVRGSAARPPHYLLIRHPTS